MILKWKRENNGEEYVLRYLSVDSKLTNKTRYLDRNLGN